MMNMKSLVLAVVATVACSSFAENWYVSESGDDNNDGKSWETAFRRLSKAMGKATSGDKVWVEDGFECSAAKDDVKMAKGSGSGLAGDSYMVIVPPGVTLSSCSGDWRKGATIRGYQADPAGANGISAGSWPCVGLKAGASLIGIRCVEGMCTDRSHPCGGICFADNVSIVSNCYIGNCITPVNSNLRGAVYAPDSYKGAKVFDCVVENCTLGAFANCVVYDTVIRKCDSAAQKGVNTFYGGAVSNMNSICFSASGTQVYGTEIAYNDQERICTGTSSLFSKCDIHHNSRTNHTTAIALFGGIGTVVSNCTIHANRTDSTAASMKNASSGGLVFGSGVMAFGCTVTDNVLKGAIDNGTNKGGVIGASATLVNCYVADNEVATGSAFVRDCTVVNTVLVHTNADIYTMCYNGKFINSTVFGNGMSCPGASTNSVFLSGDGKTPDDKLRTNNIWTDRTPPVNCCTSRTDDPTGTSFSDDPQLDTVPGSKSFLMPLKDSPCIDKCTGDFDFDWMHAVGAKDACKHKRVFGLAADIGGVEYKPTYGLQVLLR